MRYRHLIGGWSYEFEDLKTLLAKATPLRSGDVLAGVAAETAQERVAAQKALAELPLSTFLNETVVPYETDEITRLIIDSHDRNAFKAISHLTVGGFRDWLLSSSVTSETIAQVSRGITPEMAAAVSKIMRLQDLIIVGQKCRVITKFRNTIGLEGRLSTRVQPNHPTDDPRGVAASMLDGLLLGGGDAVIGINPATDNVDACIKLLEMIDALRQKFDMPTQSCVLTHVTNTIEAMKRGAPVDLVFQSIAGTETANRGFGVDLAILREAREMAIALHRGTVGDNVMYFETGQGSALSSGSHHGVDQQTIESRAYAVAREFSPLLVNTVVGFIGPEYLYDGKQIIRAGLEDHFCGKLLGVPMGCDICYTNHAEADQDDMDALLTLLGAAGCTFIMGVPGADDVMLNYQSTSYHDALFVRKALGKRPAPEFESWLERMGIFDAQGDIIPAFQSQKALESPIVMALSRIDSNEAALSIRKASAPQIWQRAKQFTPARIGIETKGVSQPTDSNLDFQWDHALARDAVHAALDSEKLSAHLSVLKLGIHEVHSRAASREEYLQRPDYGRSLDTFSKQSLSAKKGNWDVVFVIADGLSATAVQRHSAPLLIETFDLLDGAAWKMAPIVIAHEARVAIGDQIALSLGADMAVVLIGERPGLSSPDSLGVYLTWNPQKKTVDSERNCISNIRPQGLPYRFAAAKLVYLMNEARRIKLSGVGLKEELALPDTEEVSLLAGE
jgi:ethanolamine ammonia-lyase large subunit